jgi:hypothetical protein
VIRNKKTAITHNTYVGIKLTRFDRSFQFSAAVNTPANNKTSIQPQIEMLKNVSTNAVTPKIMRRIPQTTLDFLN